jgi:putative hemolysin
MSDLLRVLGLLVLIAGNAFFVIGEYAVVTSRRSVLARRTGAGARAALRLMDDPVRVISTTQVGISALAILTGALGEPVVRDLLGDGVPRWLSFLIAFVVITYFSVVLGELFPKALTLDRAEQLAALIARPIELMAKVLRPVVAVLQWSAGVLLRPFGVRDIVAGESVRSADELRALVDEAEGSGIIPRAQEELLHNVFDFADREVRDVMVPAYDVDWLEADLRASEALDRVRDAPHSRYPVAHDSLDRLRGVVAVYDVVDGARRDPVPTVGELARDAYVVPETKDLGALLRELREAREKLALVLDEYGGVAGIVSMEDVLEELVGEIEDEYDLPDSRLQRLDDRTVLVAGSMTVDDFNEELGTELPQEGPRTLAGVAFEALGRRPEPGDAVDVAGANLRVEELDGLRISRLRVLLPEA